MRYLLTLLLLMGEAARLTARQGGVNTANIWLQQDKRLHTAEQRQLVRSGTVKIRLADIKLVITGEAHALSSY